MSYDVFYNTLAISHGQDNNLHLLDVYRMEVFKDIIIKHSKDKQLNVLDVGSRNAWLYKTLKTYKVKANYTCLDISEHYVRMMKEKNIDAILGNICETTMFKDNTFDIVVLGEILEHLPNLESALLECNRILKTNGKIIGSVSNVWNIGNFIRVLFKRDTDSSGQHIHFFDVHHLRNLFELLKFKDIKIWLDLFSFSLAKFRRLNTWLSKITGTGINVFFEVNKK
jgi:SAM-dependent methyltransferase